MTSCKVVCQQGCYAPLLDDPAVRLPDYEILIIFDKNLIVKWNRSCSVLVSFK